jgi:hypothetical protein
MVLKNLLDFLLCAFGSIEVIEPPLRFMITWKNPYVVDAKELARVCFAKDVDG